MLRITSSSSRSITCGDTLAAIARSGAIGAISEQLGQRKHTITEGHGNPEDRPRIHCFQAKVFCASCASDADALTLRSQPNAEMSLTKPVLVTGGAGFLGSHLCQLLLDHGDPVICADNMITGSESNLLGLLGNPGFKLIRHDVVKPLYVDVDQIYNLACPASPVKYQIDPVKTIKTSVQGAINMLDLAKRTGATVLQASTSEIYGDPEVHPQPEDYWGRVNPIGLRACYDEGKRCAEALFFDYHRQHNVNIRVARIFNAYGPNMTPEDGRAVSTFIVQALRNEPITVFGDGSQTRSFCYVDDLVSALFKMMNAPNGLTGPLNIGNPAEHSILELARIIIRLTGSRSKVIFRPLPEDDPVQRRPDIRSATTTLDWEPRVPLEEGLQVTIEYFDTRLSSGRVAAAR